MPAVKRSKYGVRNDAAGREARTMDGIVFASLREKKRYWELKLLERGNKIDNLEIQPEFTLQVDGVLICKYRADFRYKIRPTGSWVVEDVKGMKTPVYRLKKKLLYALTGIEISEV